MPRARALATHSRCASGKSLDFLVILLWLLSTHPDASINCCTVKWLADFVDQVRGTRLRLVGCLR